MPEAILGPIAGSVVGGLMSDGGEQQTASKEPWSEAAPWLKSNIAQGQNLQAYYQQNPFNQQQQTAYQNLFSDLDNFRSNMAPGMMQFANQAMNGGGYQRPQYSRPGAAGYGQQPSLRDQVLAAYRNTPGAEVNPSAESVEYWMTRGLGGFADEVNRVRQENPQLAARIDSDRQRLYGHQANQAPQGSPFSVAEPQQQKQYGGLLGFGKTSPVSQSYGLLDFNAMNPYNGALKPAEITQPTQQTVEEAVRAELERRQKEAANQYDRFA